MIVYFAWLHLPQVIHFFSRKENIVFVIMAIEEALKTAHICARSNFIFLRMNFNPFLTLHTSSNVTWFKHVSSESKEPSEAAFTFCFFFSFLYFCNYDYAIIRIWASAGEWIECTLCGLLMIMTKNNTIHIIASKNNR